MGRPRLYATRAQCDHAYYLRKKERQQYPPFPPGPYRVLYADPPWKYTSPDPDAYRHAHEDYPPLSRAELQITPVRRILSPQAVSFLWVPSALLPDAVVLMKSWGVRCHDSIIWDKMRLYYGRYVSAQHEVLLIGTRGTYHPEIDILHPSVQRHRRSDQGRKPDVFRLLIEEIYPTGPHLELFPQTQGDGWDVWPWALDEDAGARGGN